jgi:hypothetical protein
MLGNRDPPSAPLFEKMSLDRLSFSIRLLRIKLLEGYEIEWLLKIYDLKSSPPFVALSYEWGENSANRKIRLNGHDILIRENLYQALRSLTAEMRNSDSESASGGSLMQLHLR